MQTVKAHFDGNVFIPIDRITAAVNQRAVVTFTGYVPENKTKRQGSEKSYLRYAGVLSDESRVEIEAVLQDTERSDINEWQ
jgi:molybdopterin synthase catalytic subunit